MKPDLTPHPAKTHAYITTQSGVRVMCPGMRESMVRFEDVAHSLAMQCRYLGHVRHFYSVAEHCTLVSIVAEHFGEDMLVQKACLLHDAHEAYVGDFPSPFKEAVPGLKLFERSIEAAVRDAFDLPPDDDPIWRQVKTYDIMALHKEASMLFEETPAWVDAEIVARWPKRWQAFGTMPDRAHKMFYKRARELRIC